MEGPHCDTHRDEQHIDKDGTIAIVDKYRDILEKKKQARAGQIIYKEVYQCLET